MSQLKQGSVCRFAYEITHLEVEFESARNHPLEIYFLVDATSTMQPLREHILQVIDELVSNLKKITLKVKIGLGLFAEKRIIPFAEYSNNTETSYNFKNQVNLTTDFDLFKKKVKEFEKIRNNDAPEDWLSAFVQIVTCKEIIGWSDPARKLVILFTDEAFHHAGDGKLAGIVEVNDLSCHLDANGYYTHDKIQDYPSVSQVKYLVELKKIHLFMFINDWKDRIVNIYKELKEILPYSLFFPFKENFNESDPFKFISDNYKSIQKKVEFVSNDVPRDDLHWVIESQCPNEAEFTSKSYCPEVHPDDKAKFKFQISTSSCDKRTILFDLPDHNEKIQVDIEGICQCSCESFRKSSICNMHGDAECGSCQCHEGYYGDKCQCFTERVVKVNSNFSFNKNVCQPLSALQLVSVTTMIVNKYRDECATVGSNNLPRTHSNDDRRCKINLVYYSDKGTCHCGKCQCQPGFSGSACDCPTSNKTCLASNGDLCNGVGECNCGVCQCAKDRPFIGDTCEECPTCSDDVCQEHEFCASCFFEPDDHICHSECSTNIHPVNQLPECVSELMIIGSVVGGVAMIGVIMLVVWKVVVTVHDNKEYKKFEMERKNAKWALNVSPLYRDAVSRYRNPIYGLNKD
ncbi:hypothetical protein HELRODRAFT_189200 [Helobdella robusta]|uniref:Integrin beta n=1 Tax=Helobdella robusta TaxID=6412 RepID=T1FQS1_HELRO|nr:hypothetical protein HELRODRAFT_189200 [Helobdella robusta]ESN96335.1 hypothetical protein HELRODRAFT_189200 [Helobdella robusta]